MILFIVLCLLACIVVGYVAAREGACEWWEVLVLGLLGAAVMAFVLVVIDSCWTKDDGYAEGTVVHRSYEAPSSWTSMGTDSNGNTSFQNHYKAESYNLIVEVDGRVDSHEVSPFLFAGASEGKQVYGHWRLGVPFGIVREFRIDGVKL